MLLSRWPRPDAGWVALLLLPLLGACETLKARSMAQDGVDKYRNGDIKGAAELFEKAARLEPNMPVIQLNRGYTHLSLFQLSPKSKEGMEAATVAIDAFKTYLKLNITPEQRQKARDYLLQTFADAHRYEEAVEFFKPQVDKDPPDLEALTILANIARSVGKISEARMWMEKRIRANPKDPDAYVALATLDWDQLCNDSQCRIPPERRSPMVLPPEQRLEMANHGIELCKKAAELAPHAPTPLIYWNLLLRERQYAYVPSIPQPTNPRDTKAQQQYQEELERVNKLKAEDLAAASELLKKALEMQKAATGADAGKPPSPPHEPAKEPPQEQPRQAPAAPGSPAAAPEKPEKN
ncbi:MAG: hypothetical protein NZ890_03480 [Myxococcota bacterium]|nr:hypothetical protein [Myxococcota bacterium]